MDFKLSTGLAEIFNVPICSNSRVLNTKLPGVISFLKALPIWAMPKGTFLREVVWTFLKLTKMPWGGFRPQINVFSLAFHNTLLGFEHQVKGFGQGPSQARRTGGR